MPMAMAMDLLVANTTNYPEFLYRNDTDLDFFAARTNGPNALYRNDGNWSFVEQEAGDLSGVRSASSMACWADVDGEDAPDLYVGNLVDSSTVPQSEQRNYFYANQGNFEFVEIRSGHAAGSRAITYGTSATDADNDGDLDLYVANWGNGDQDNVMYKNLSQGRWLTLRLEGSTSNRMAVGASITLVTRYHGQTSRQSRRLNTTTGYASQNEPILHFGLGGAMSVESLSIDWPSRRHDAFSDIGANQHLRIREGDT